jgi:hypothetical protein
MEQAVSLRESYAQLRQLIDGSNKEPIPSNAIQQALN